MRPTGCSGSLADCGWCGGADAAADRAGREDSLDVVGLQPPVVSFVEQLTERLLVVSRRNLRAHPDFFPQRVLVALCRPTVSFDRAYRIESAAGGTVRVDFRWDAANIRCCVTV